MLALLMPIRDIVEAIPTGKVVVLRAGLEKHPVVTHNWRFYNQLESQASTSVCATTLKKYNQRNRRNNTKTVYQMRLITNINGRVLEPKCNENKLLPPEG
jgi:hypothetical protein